MMRNSKMTPSIPTPHSFLATVERALHMLGSVTTLNEVIDFRNQAEALRVLAQRSRYGLAAQNACAEIRIRAERKIGISLDAMDRQRVGRPQLVARGDYYGVPRLRDLGITKSISYRARRLAEIPTELFETYIADAVEGYDELTCRGLILHAERQTHAERSRQRIRGGAVADLVAFAAAGHRVGTVLVDPPWEITGASNLLPYEAITIEDIKALPVAAFCAERAHCHLWCLPNPTLFRAEEILVAWGFRPVSILTWGKTGALGRGGYWRHQTEHLVTGVRGDADRFDDKGLSSWIEAPRGRHSEKPEVIYEMVERGSPPPRVELFARIRRPGWFAWGHEVHSDALRVGA